MKKITLKTLLFIIMLGFSMFYLINIPNKGNIEAAIIGEGTEENPYIIDEESDFSLMNGSSAYFKMINDIIIQDSTTSLGIETFSGVFEGGGYSIKNLNGSFVKELSGTINDVTIDSPRTFVASMDISTSYIGDSKSRYAYLRKQEAPNDGTSMNAKPQYFGYVCGKITSGNLNSVRVTNATIDTNSHTNAHHFGTDYTTSYVGFIAGYASSSNFYNCTVDSSTLIYSTSYGVGGIAGAFRNGTLLGCMIRNLTITGKNGININQMSKAYSGIMVGIIEGSTVSKNIAVDISQGTTPYLSMFGFISSHSGYSNSYIYFNDTYYDETVAPFSTNYYEDDQYEFVYGRENTNSMEIQNAGCDSYGNIHDGENNNLDRTHYIRIKRVNEYDSSTSTSSIIDNYNEIIEAGSYGLKRSTETYLPNYVSKMEHKIKVDFQIDEITYGDLLIDKIHYSVDEENTNFDANILFKYKPSSWSDYVNLDDENRIADMSFDWYILYQHNGVWYELPDAFGTVEVKPYDISNAYISYKESVKYTGSEYKNNIYVYTGDRNYDLSFDITGTTSATEIGTYSFTITGKDNATGSITKTWSITSGEMKNISVNDTNVTYDGSSQIFTVTGAPEGSTILYSLDGVSYKSDLNLVNAGEYTVYYKISHPEYNDYAGQTTFTIRKRTITVTWLSKEIEYTGKPQIPPYELGNIIPGDEVDIIVNDPYYETNVFTGSSDGYYAQTKEVTNPNYQVSTSSVIFKIVPKVIELPFASESVIDTKVYNGESQQPTFNDSEYYYIETSSSWIDVGQHTVEVYLKDTRNYKWEGIFSTYVTYIFEIIPAENKWIVEPTIEGWVYGETKNSVLYEALYDGDLTVWYTLKEDPTTKTKNKPTNAGEYEVYVELSSNNFTNVLSATLGLTIEKGDLKNVTAPSAKNAKYGQTLAEITLPSTSTGVWCFADELSTPVGNVGANKFTVKLVPKDQNYKDFITEITINVSKVDPKYTAPSKVPNLEYTGLPQALVTPGTVEDDVLVIEYKIEDLTDWSTEIPSVTDAGYYYVYYRIVGGNNYNNVESYVGVELAVSVIETTELVVADVHFNKDNNYEFDLLSIKFNKPYFKDTDYEIVEIYASSTVREPGSGDVRVKLKMLNENYEFKGGYQEYTFTTIVEFKEHTTDSHINGIMECCGGYQTPTLNEEGYYEIANAGNLYWLAEKVNSTIWATTKAKLTQDITLIDEITWIPIGLDDDYYFRGEFDGNNYSISNFKLNITKAGIWGLFGYVRNATIKNFSINGNVETNFTSLLSNEYTTYGVIARAYYDNTFSNIHSSVDFISNDNFYKNYISGIVGVIGNTNQDQKTNINNCSFDGTINMKNANGHSNTNYYGYVGGILAYYDTNRTSIEVNNCAFYGTILSETEGKYQIGGISGYWLGSKSKLMNCLSVGTITANNSKYTGAIAGTVTQSSYANQIMFNNYYSSGNAFGNSDSEYDITDGYGNQDPAKSATLVTLEQLKNGEVTYLLNNKTTGVWKQILGEDDYPQHEGSDVYYGYVSCATNSGIEYTNNANVFETKPLHQNEEGICPICNENIVAIVTIGEHEYYYPTLQEAMIMANTTTENVVVTAINSSEEEFEIPSNVTFKVAEELENVLFNTVINKGIVLSGTFNNMTNEGEIFGGKYNEKLVNHGTLNNTVDSPIILGEEIEYTNLGTVNCTNHFGGNATCIHYAVCILCDVSYGELNENNHTLGEIVYTWNNDHSECEVSSVCLLDETHLINETAKITKVIEDAKCGIDGKITYTATFNNDAYETQVYIEKIDALVHEYDETTWGYKDADGHAHLCVHGCGTHDDLIEHTSSGEATEDVAEVCTVCGYEINPKLESKPGLSGGQIAGIVFGVLALLGGLFTVYWFVLRKKFLKR